MGAAPPPTITPPSGSGDGRQPAWLTIVSDSCSRLIVKWSVSTEPPTTADVLLMQWPDAVFESVQLDIAESPEAEATDG